MRAIILICMSLLFFSCEKKELPVPKYDRGDLLTREIDMGVNYKNQVWFSLSANKIVSTNLKTDWDLAFETDPGGYRITLNGSKAMKVYRTGFSSLSEVTDTTGLGVNGKADTPTGNMDSTAIGNWRENNPVYVVHRGYNESGQTLGFYKLKITNVSSTQFTFEYGPVFGSQLWQGTVTKDALYNTVAYSFTSHQQVFIEPKKQDYDLCFTQYTHLFTDPLQYYQVTGVLNNTLNTRIAKVKNKLFHEISISDTLGLLFNPNRNAIGYDWKSFDLNTNLYTVDVKSNYIIRDNKGFYYKLHFIDFYNSQGIKGFPKFEFIKL